MSLLNTASPWNSSGSDTRRKRIIGKDNRKTQKAPLFQKVSQQENHKIHIEV